jgi:membrane-associated phospholipid phosphatase
MIAIHVLLVARAARPKNPLLTFARLSYPLFLIFWLYQETGLVNLFITGMYHDQVFIALEESIFGYHPVVRFMEALPYRGVAELLYLAYFSYYSLVVGVAFALYAMDRKQYFRYASVISLIFFVCYLAFIIAPVLGPKAILIPEYAEAVGIDYHVPPVPPGVEVALFYRIMSVVHSNMQVIGAAFPSSHVAVSLGVLYFAWISFRRVRYLILLAVTLLAISTVYCRYHYAVDVFGGIIIAAAVIPLGKWLSVRESP